MSLDIQSTAIRTVTVGDFNITHNLTTMAKEAGVYSALWHPSNLDIKTAFDLLPYIVSALQNLHAKPNYYKSFESGTGWGTYDQFVRMLEKLESFCINNLDAKLEVSL